MDKVLLKLTVQQGNNCSFWAGSLSVGNKTKTFSGVFEGPLTKQQAMCFALVELVRKLKKPVEIETITSAGNKDNYFKDAFHLFFKDTGKHNFTSFQKADVSDLKDALIAEKRKYVPSEQPQIISHDDFDEII